MSANSGTKLKTLSQALGAAAPLDLGTDFPAGQVGEVWLRGSAAWSFSHDGVSPAFPVDANQAIKLPFQATAPGGDAQLFVAGSGTLSVAVIGWPQ